MLRRFENILDVVATVAKVLRVAARGQMAMCSAKRRTFVEQVAYPRFSFSQPRCLRGSHRYDLTACIACERCATNCPGGSIHVGKERVPGRRGVQVTSFTIDYGKCLLCGLCTRLCPTDSIVLESSRGPSRRGGQRGIVDFSRLPVEVAWGPWAFDPTVTARSKVITRLVKRRTDGNGN
jgi:NADH-quinone oxidoreductase subunit I